MPSLAITFEVIVYTCSTIPTYLNFWWLPLNLHLVLLCFKQTCRYLHQRATKLVSYQVSILISFGQGALPFKLVTTNFGGHLWIFARISLYSGERIINYSMRPYERDARFKRATSTWKEDVLSTIPISRILQYLIFKEQSQNNLRYKNNPRKI